MLKTELEVVTVGTPDITALSDDERRVFFETIMARVLELAKERKAKFILTAIIISPSRKKTFRAVKAEKRQGKVVRKQTA